MGNLMMRAVVMRPGELLLTERQRPMPGPGQALVRTIACGICGSDLHLYRHAADYRAQAVAAGVAEEVLDRGVVLGHEFVGEIIEYGPDVEAKLPLGQRVCSTPFVFQGDSPLPIGNSPYVDGAYAEYMLLSESLLLPVPDSLSSEAAALVEPLAIGLHAVNKAPLASERSAVVLGCGPIGLAVIAVLKSQGVSTIIGADLSRRRRELAAIMGASDVFDPATGSVFSVLDDTGAVNIFDCTGARPVLGALVDEAPHSSTIVIAGIVHGEQSFNPGVAISKELNFHFVIYYTPDEFAQSLQLLASGQINWQPWVTGRVSLEDVPGVFAELEDPERHAKVIIYPHGVSA